MKVRLMGLKAWIFFIVVLIMIILFFVFLLGFFILLLPIIVLLIVLGFLFGLVRRIKRKGKKEKKDYIDVKYKVKK